MTKQTTSISISIDLRDDFEKSLLQHVKGQVNKSRFLKRLIYADMMNIQTAQETTITMHENVETFKQEMAGFF